MSDDTLPGPVPTLPDPEQAIRAALIEDAVVMLGRLQDMTRTGNPLRALRLTETYVKATRRVLAQIALDDGDADETDGDDERENLHEGFGRGVIPVRQVRGRPRRGHGDVAPGDPQTQMLGAMDSLATTQQIQALTTALGDARRQGDKDLAARIQDQLDRTLPPRRGPPVDPEADARVEALIKTIEPPLEAPVPPSTVYGVTGAMAGAAYGPEDF